MLLRFLANYRWEILLIVGLHAPTWGFWVLTSGPLNLSGLAFDLVWWGVLIVLPALVMAVLYVRLRGRGYGWEGLLLVAIPFWALRAEFACQTLVFSSLLTDSERWGGLALGLLDWGIPAQFVTVILLAALYPAVSRLERRFLRLTWQFLLAVALIGVVVDGLLLTMRLRGTELVSGMAMRDAMLLGSLLAGPFALFLLFGFIRGASRYGLPHALFMVALAFSFPWYDLLEPSAAAIPETRMGYVGVATLQAATRSVLTGATVFAAWLLFNFDAWNPILRRRAVAALIAVRALGVPVLLLLPIVGTGHWPMPTGDTTKLLLSGITFLAWGVVFCAAYLFSARRHEPLSDTPSRPSG